MRQLSPITLPGQLTTNAGTAMSHKRKGRSIYTPKNRTDCIYKFRKIVKHEDFFYFISNTEITQTN